MYILWGGERDILPQGNVMSGWRKGSWDFWRGKGGLGREGQLCGARLRTGQDHSAEPGECSALDVCAVFH